MSDGATLLQAAIDNPNDAEVRLVYADWLDENGQGDWAELVRIQVEIASLEEQGHLVPEADRECVSCQRLIELRKRERELLGVSHIVSFPPLRLDVDQDTP